MAARVLRDKVTQVSSESHIRNCGFPVSPFGDWEAFEENESLPVDELLAERVEEFREMGKLKFCSSDSCQGCAAGDKCICSI
jgi:hypothetical protein